MCFIYVTSTTSGQDNVLFQVCLRVAYTNCMLSISVQFYKIDLSYFAHGEPRDHILVEFNSPNDTLSAYRRNILTLQVHKVS